MLILLNESAASRRCVPIMCFQSNGTSACTNESGRTFMFAMNGVFYGSGGSISAVSSVDGAYMANFAASKLSVLGHGMVIYSSNTALPWMTPFQVVPIDSFDSMRLGLFALPNAAAEASGGLITHGTGTGQLHTSNGSVGLKAQTHSQATVGGADNLGRREYSDLTVRIGLVAYSGATVGAGNIAPGSYSGVSVEVKTGGIQVASIGKGAYSGVSVEVTTGGIQVVSIGKGSYSGVTVGIDNIKGASYSDVTIQGVSNTANFPGGSSNASSPAEIADFVWASYLTRTLKGDSSDATLARVVEITSGVTLKANTHSGATIQGLTRALNLSSNGDKTGYSISGTKTTLDALNDIDGSGVTLHAGTHSNVTIQGLTRALNLSANGDKTGYSISGTKTTLDALNDIDGSGVTLHAGTHSNVTIQGVTRLNSSVTLNANTHSGATIAGIVAGGIIASTLASGTITSAKFGAGAVDAAALATDAVAEIADGLLGRNLAGGSDGGRTVTDALRVLRNRVQIQGSTGTVFQENDTSSAWTFAVVSLATLPLGEIDPGGP